MNTESSSARGTFIFIALPSQNLDHDTTYFYVV